MRTLTVAGLLLAAAVQCAYGRTFGCDKVWKNASADNQIDKCFTDTNHLQELALQDDHLPLVILAAIPLVLFVIGFFCCPVTTTCRYCCKCCGSYRRRPGTVCCGGAEWDEASSEEKEAEYPRSSVRNTKAAAVMVMMFSIAALICTVNGTSSMNTTYNRVFIEVKGILTFVDTQSLAIRTVMTINGTNGAPDELIPPLTPAFFDNITAKTTDFRKTIDDAKTTADPYVANANLVALLIGIIPIVCLVLTVVCSVCDIRTCVLCVNSCFHYLFFIPYAIFGCIFLLLGLLLGDVCGERELFLSNPQAPGLISLAGIPLCDQNVPFETIKGDVRSVVTEQAQSACTTLLTICSNTSTVYSLSQPKKFFSCPTLSNVATQCVTFANTSSIANSMTLLTGAPTTCMNGSTLISPCDFSQCSSFCTDGSLRNSTRDVSLALHYASNAEFAFDSFVSPLLSCQTLYFQALRPLVVCNDLVESVYFIGGGFLGYTIFFLAGMVVIWRGQKRFFKTKSIDTETEEDDDHTDEEEFDDIRAAGRKQRNREPYRN